MAGYCGYSMSNNAINAYELGEAPLSKWSKSKIISAAEEQGVEREIIEILKKHSLTVLRQNALEKSSWHHTSKYFNRTNFYSVIDFENVTLKEIAEWKIYENPVEKPYRVLASWTTWEGNYRRYKKPVRHEATGKIVGKWFFPDECGPKKLVYGNSFNIIKRLP